MSDFPYRWVGDRWRSEDRHGERCRILAVGRMYVALVEFVDGFRMLTSGNFVRGVVGDGRDDSAHAV